ncbi:hypothetical protein Tco_0111716 [Tanacetum coccineum]
MRLNHSLQNCIHEPRRLSNLGSTKVYSNVESMKEDGTVLPFYGCLVQSSHDDYISTSGQAWLYDEMDRRQLSCKLRQPGRGPTYIRSQSALGSSCLALKNKVCKLVKSLYGLKQAPKQWHQNTNRQLLQAASIAQAYGQVNFSLSENKFVDTLCQ